MPARRLVVVCGLAIGDYLVWMWSLNANHDVLALISGLTLVPLALVGVLLLAVTVMRGLMGLTRRAPQAGRARARRRQDVGPRRGDQPVVGARPAGEAERSRRKLAA